MSLNPLVAARVVASTATTDAVYVLFNPAVSDRRRIRAASWSAIWYLLSAFRSNQLPAKCYLCIVCGDRFIDWCVLCRDLAQARVQNSRAVSAQAGSAAGGSATVIGV